MECTLQNLKLKITYDGERESDWRWWLQHVSVQKYSVQNKGYNLIGVTTVEASTTRGTTALVYCLINSSLYTGTVHRWWSTSNWPAGHQGCSQLSTSWYTTALHFARCATTSLASFYITASSSTLKRGDENKINHWKKALMFTCILWSFATYSYYVLTDVSVLSQSTKSLFSPFWKFYCWNLTVRLFYHICRHTGIPLSLNLSTHTPPPTALLTLLCRCCLGWGERETWLGWERDLAGARHSGNR
jgi:hypothetical protein